MPAGQVDRRGLFCSPRRYRTLIGERLDAIRAHGESARYGAFFPTYLLKCLQDFFDRYGDELYLELKHVCNALESLQASLASAQRASEQSRHVEAIAAAPLATAGPFFDTSPSPSPARIRPVASAPDRFLRWSGKPFPITSWENRRFSYDLNPA